MLKDNMHLENFENQRVLKMHYIVYAHLERIRFTKILYSHPQNLLSPGCGRCMGCGAGGGGPGGSAAGVTVCCMFCDGNWLVAVGVVCVMPSRSCIM